MPSDPLIVFVHSEHPYCPLVQLFKRALEVNKNGGNANDSKVRENESNDITSRLSRLVPGGLAGRILSVKTDSESRIREIWIRVSGTPKYIEAFEKVMRMEYGVSYQKIFGNKFNVVYRIILNLDKCPRESSKCLHLSAPYGVMIKSSIVHPSGLFYELIVAKPKLIDELRDMGFETVLVHEISGYDYMLTLKQELALIYAYLAGYYKFPRSISLKALANELGLSVSTLAELLRKAESKVIEAFIRHEMPHYFVNIVLNRNEYKEMLSRLAPVARSV